MSTSSRPPPIPQSMGLLRVTERLIAFDDNMPVAQAMILLLVATIDPSKQIGITEIAARVGMQASRVSRNIAALEKAGLLEKARDPADPRAKFVWLSKAGDALVRQLAGYVS